jgi:hypothetical protein
LQTEEDRGAGQLLGDRDGNGVHTESSSDIHVPHQVFSDGHFMHIVIVSIFLDNEIRLEVPVHTVKDISPESFHFLGSCMKPATDETYAGN